MVVRRSHFASILLLAVASAIAVVEYVMYSPATLPQSIDDGGVQLFEQSDDAIDSDEEITVTEPSEDGETEDQGVSSLQQNAGEDAGQAKPKAEETSAPFANSGEYKAAVSSGDTMASLLGRLGFDKADVYLASKAISKVFNLKSLKIGQEILVRGGKDTSGDLVLKGIEFRPDYRFKITVTRGDSGFSAEKSEVPIKKVIRSVSGVISPKSPKYSLEQCGVKPQISTEALRSLAQIVNIKTSRSPVDFEFLYRDFYDDEGNIVRSPELLYASVLIDGKIKRIYKFSDNGATEYVDSNGVILRTLAARSSMLAQPIGVMRITSRFGMRRHPISGRIKGHTGVDVKANVGTPVRAAASGTISRASYYSGYGRYVNIKHGGGISTAYGHLSRIVVRGGQHVSQGQIIGYTGNSGQSTGPHLHYEVIKNGRFINPMTFVKQEPQKLTGQKLARFNRFKKEVNLQVVGLTPTTGKNKTAAVKKIS